VRSRWPTTCLEDGGIAEGGGRTRGRQQLVMSIAWCGVVRRVEQEREREREVKEVACARKEANGVSPGDAAWW
jgi:hypothetical protein